MPAGAAPPGPGPAGVLQRPLRLFLFLLRFVAGACPGLCGRHDPALRTRTRPPRGGSRQQRRLSAPILPGGRHSRPGRRARPKLRRSRRRQGHPHRSPLLRRRNRPRPRARPFRRPHGGQQRARPRAGHQRLRRRLPDPAQAGGRRHLRVPPPAESDPAQRIRHHLPRALFLSVASLHAADLRRPRPDRLRRGGNRQPRRLPAALRPPRREQPPARQARRRPRAGQGGTGRPDPPGRLPGLRQQGAEGQTRSAQVPDRRPGSRTDRRRLRRPRQGQYPAQLLRRPHRPARLHRGSQPS